MIYAHFQLGFLMLNDDDSYYYYINSCLFVLNLLFNDTIHKNSLKKLAMDND
jgi:hypothetical protein